MSNEERQVRPISLEDYFSAEQKAMLNEDSRANATNLLTRVNRFLQKFGQFRRPMKGRCTNETGSGRRHDSCEAVDLMDPEGDLDQFVMDNQRFLETCGLWAEHAGSTKGFCHLQCVPPLSGRRIFYA